VEPEPLLILGGVAVVTVSFFALSGSLLRRDREAWLAARRSELEWEAFEPSEPGDEEQRSTALDQARSARELAERRLRMRLMHLPHQVVAGTLRLGWPEDPGGGSGDARSDEEFPDDDEE
jgi:hypothetical protein